MLGDNLEGKEKNKAKKNVQRLSMRCGATCRGGSMKNCDLPRLFGGAKTWIGDNRGMMIAFKCILNGCRFYRSVPPLDVPYEKTVICSK